MLKVVDIEIPILLEEGSGITKVTVEVMVLIMLKDNYGSTEGILELSSGMIGMAVVAKLSVG